MSSRQASTVRPCFKQRKNQTPEAPEASRWWPGRGGDYSKFLDLLLLSAAVLWSGDFGAHMGPLSQRVF